MLRCMSTDSTYDIVYDMHLRHRIQHELTNLLCRMFFWTYDIVSSGIITPWIRIVIFVYTCIYKYMMVNNVYTCIYLYIHVYVKTRLYIQVYTSTCYENIFQIGSIIGAQFHAVVESTDTYPMQCMTYCTV